MAEVRPSPPAATRPGPPPAERPYDVVLFGATGCCGQLAAEYLAAHYPQRDPVPPEGSRDAAFKWALAGRSRDRLEQLARRLAPQTQCPLVLADAHDPASLRALAVSTRVVASCAGPFAKHSDGMVRACVASGTHYVDITGETEWVGGLMAEGLGAAARASGSIVVPFCGIDSAPADLGVLLLAEHIRQTHGGAGLARVEMVADMKLHPAPGGVATALDMMSQPARLAAVRDLNVLLPPAAGVTAAALPRWPADRRWGTYDSDRRCWLAPYVRCPRSRFARARSLALLARPPSSEGGALRRAGSIRGCTQATRARPSCSWCAQVHVSARGPPGGASLGRGARLRPFLRLRAGDPLRAVQVRRGGPAGRVAAVPPSLLPLAAAARH